MAAALPQSRPRPVPDGDRDGRIYGAWVFGFALVALSGQAESRDALVLAAQLTHGDGTVVVAHVLATSAAPLTGGRAAAASRRAGLRDAGEEVYATLGPDPRARYLPVSGLPFAEAVRALAHREHPDAIVIGQNLLAHEPGVRGLLVDVTCPVVVAPYGHRFVRSFAAARVTVAGGPPGSTDDGVLLATALAERAGAELRLIVAGRSAAAIVALTRGDVDVLVTVGPDHELLRQAACPVVVVPPSVSVTRRLAGEGRR
jgi:hypothetical protein